MADTDAFVPDAEFVGKNMFYLVLAIGFFILIGFMVRSLINNKARNYGPLEKSYTTQLVSDVIKHRPVKNIDLDCPRDPHKYSFTFFLKIDDFYCNRGYWKCVMIKGSPVEEEGTKCHESINKLGNADPDSKCDVKALDKTKIDAAKLSSNPDLALLLDKIAREKATGIIIEGKEHLFKKLDIICTAIQAGEEGIKELAYAVAHCGFFRDENGDEFKMTEAVCQDYIKKHKTYCNKVYAIDKKVARQADLERIRQITELESQIAALEKNKESLTENNNNPNLEERIRELKKRVNDSRKYDDFDSICSVDNLLNQYPGIIPDTVEVLQENDLINLSQKNKMDLIHSNPDTTNFEGCYNSCHLLENKVEIHKSQANTQYIYGYLSPAFDKNNNPQICNSEALQKGYDYYGISPLGNCFGLKTEDIKDLNTIEDSKCSLAERKGGPDTYNFITSDPAIIEDYQFQCDSTTANRSDSWAVYVSKVKEVGANIVSDCWRDLIERYPYQSPGVWLHPFVNNLRIVFTTNSKDNYQRYINDLSHAAKGNPANQEVKPVNISPDDHAALKSFPSESSCGVGTVPLTNFYYRESFDVLNIPINNEFHLAIIVNNQSVEVYVNAELKQTIKLFGNPTFNQGDLHINPETKPKLGGTVKEFQFFPEAIDYRNISKIMNNRKASQSRTEEAVLIPLDHSHQIEVAHDHPFHPLEETNHKHSIEGDDLPQEYQ